MSLYTNFSYLAGVTKRTFNFFYHFDFIYKNSALYQKEREYTEVAERLPCKVSWQYSLQFDSYVLFYMIY